MAASGSINLMSSVLLFFFCLQRFVYGNFKQVAQNCKFLYLYNPF